MNELIKFLSVDALVAIIQLAVIRIGNKFKDKDDNDTGTDDATGNALIAIAPVLPALVSGSDSLKKKTMLAAYNAFGNYLGLAAVPESKIK